jgi:hypothetical protein
VFTQFTLILVASSSQHMLQRRNLTALQMSTVCRQCTSGSVQHCQSEPRQLVNCLLFSILITSLENARNDLSTQTSQQKVCNLDCAQTTSQRGNTATLPCLLAITLLDCAARSLGRAVKRKQIGDHALPRGGFGFSTRGGRHRGGDGATASNKGLRW